MEEPKRKTLYTPGFFDNINHIVFEQIRGNKYAISPNAYPKPPPEGYGIIDDYSRGLEDYFPLERTAWPLVARPLNYGSLNELWKEIKPFYEEHFYHDDAKVYDVLTAFTLCTWVIEVWPVVPYLFIHGPIATGKTRLAELMHRLCYRGLISSNISPSALFRAVDQWKPTLFLDESEIYNAQTKSEIQNLLNSGYRRGQPAIRVKNTNQGQELETFDVFGFKILVGTEGFKETLESRCIAIKTVKAQRKVRLFIDERKAEVIRAKLMTWRFSYLETFNGQVGEGCEGYEGCEAAKLGEGRIVELFLSLLSVANDGRESIMKFAENMATERLEESKTGLDADIIEILCKIDESDLEENAKHEKILPIKTVKAQLNKSRDETDQYGSEIIGRTLKKLGFQLRRLRNGNGYLYDVERMNLLRGIYLEGTQPSQLPQPSQEQLLEVCKFCGKPIESSIHDHIGLNLDEDAHIDCAEKWRELKGTSRIPSDNGMNMS
jgi:hypothetical protein